MYNELSKQMELGFNSPTIIRPARVRRRRLPQAGWWFDQIRKRIDGDDAPPAPRSVQGRLEFPPTRTLSFPA